jgi:hypothetical protein
LPEDDGSCSPSSAPARIGVLDDNSDTTALPLQSTMQVMKSDLVEFVDGTPNLSWSYREHEMSRSATIGPKAVRVARGMRIPSVVTMPDSDLEHIESGIINRDAPSNLIQVARLKSVTGEIVRREQERVTARIRRLAAVALAKPVVPAPAPAPALAGSSDPYNAPAPSGQQVYIQPHSSVWYSASDGFRRLTMYIDANHQTGLSMSIYGPDQQDVWHEKPAGKPGPGEGHDFFWTGRSAFKGSWRIKLTNNNDFAVPYTFTAMSVSDRNGDLCRNCHGNIQDEWDRCEHSGSFCDDLKDQYKN